MNKNNTFFLIVKILIGTMGTLNLGICTSYILGKGLSFVELSFIYSLILGTSLILEYPSGNLADRFGRKFIYAVGLIFTSFQFIFYALFSKAILLYIAAIAGGIGDAFVSGSLEAWLTEEESKLNNQEKIYKTFGLSRSLTSVFSIVVSMLIGLFLKTNGYYIYLCAGVLVLLVSLVSILYLKDNKGSSNRTMEYTYQAFLQFIKSPILLLLAFILSSTFACYSIFILYWQPQATALHTTLNKLPLLYSYHLLGVAISSCFYSKYAKKFGPYKFIITSFVFLTISFIVMLNSGILAIIFGIFIFGLGYGVLIPLFFSWAVNTIPRDTTASILSLISAIASLVAVITTVFIGAIIKKYGLHLSVKIGLVLTIFILFSLFYLNYAKKLTFTEAVKYESNSN